MIKHIYRSCPKLSALLLVACCSIIQIVDAGETTRVSIDPSGNQFFGFGIDNHIAISADGRYVVFIAISKNLVGAGYNYDRDFFIHDRAAKLTSRLNINSKKDGKDFSDFSISADARYIAFSSSIDDLVPGDTNNSKDIFIHDTGTGVTTRVSDNGGENPQLSGDGHYVGYTSGYATPECINGGVFGYDRFSGSTICILDNLSHGYVDFVLSFNGRYLAFVDPFQVFSYDRSIPEINTITQGTGYTGRIVPSAPKITADGRYIVYYACSASGFSCAAEDIFIFDKATEKTSKVEISSYNPPSGVKTLNSGLSHGAAISADGRYLAFQMEQSYDAGYFGRTDFTAVSGTSTFVMDRTTGAISRVSINTSGVNEARAGVFDVWDGSKGLPAISADGSVVAFVSTSWTSGSI